MADGLRHNTLPLWLERQWLWCAYAIMLQDAPQRPRLAAARRLVPVAQQCTRLCLILRGRSVCRRVVFLLHINSAFEMRLMIRQEDQTLPSRMPSSLQTSRCKVAYIHRACKHASPAYLACALASHQQALVVACLVIQGRVPIMRKRPQAALLFGPPQPQPGPLAGLPPDFDHASYKRACHLVLPAIRHVMQLWQRRMDCAMG